MTDGGRARRHMASRRLAALLAASALLMAACGTAAPSPTGPEVAASFPTGTPGVTESPAASPEASPAASPVASVAPSPTAATTKSLQANTAVRVIVASLNVRESPSTGAKKLGSLAKGDVVALLGYGAIKANGYTWFQAARIKGLHGPLPALPTYPLEGGDWTDLTGWIAAGTSTTPYVVALEPRCSSATDLATVSAMLMGEQLACLGTTPLVLEGTFGCGGCGGAFPGTFKPEWLATPLSGFISVQPSVRIGPLQLYFPPDVTRPDEGQILRVHAHLADPRSSTCAVAIVTSDSPLATPVALRSGDSATWCRQHVVVDSYEVLGVDPSWPPG
jgi:hypothetical protein